MSKIIVRGGNRLTGKVKISGAKNAVLPIIAASLLGEEGTSVIHEAPPLDDVMTISKVLTSLGVHLTYEDETVTVDASHLETVEAPYELVRKMRASFLVLGPLLARKGHAKIPLPGGCAIGTRPIDQHLKGFEAMGAKIDLGHGYIEAKVEGRLKGAKIYLDVPSVGATENIMMAASLAEGTTLIENAAKEPEIVDLANYLNGMGAKVRGAGTGMIRIEGVEKMHGITHTVIPDRIEAGTFMIAAAITRGDVYVEGAIADHLKPVVSKMQEMGITVEVDENGIRVCVDEHQSLKPIDVKTLPYPGFPTDMQSQMMALQLIADGTSMMTETVFENRFMHVTEFKNMNAQIKVEGNTAIVSGNQRLTGAKVCATDLRAGAALILAGLVAEGKTEISDIYHIDRGYIQICEKFQALGGKVERAEPVREKQTAKLLETPAILQPQPSWA
ncbi:UDP-N-acetylglucosamine 1-carboxyvinyltransferase [Marinicrinis sediminis]|uniref:UDP-N-acetylglucosamine 1-carboxyvinyltransferase n=1 Tax=Marinicrinis sediminis TaxID=1652465 RepID=A0ABW5RBG8_9BACL